MKKLNVDTKTVISAPADEIFPLICPVMEYKWIPGWKCRIIRFPGQIGTGVQFKEFMSAPTLMDAILQQTTWTVVEFQPDQHRICFRLENHQSSTLLSFSFEQENPDLTHCSIHMDVTPVSTSGRHLLGDKAENKLKLLLLALQEMLKFYCENGQTMMPVGQAIRLMGLVKDIPTGTRIKSVISKLALLFYRDQNRIRFLKGQTVHVNGET